MVQPDFTGLVTDLIPRTHKRVHCKIILFSITISTQLQKTRFELVLYEGKT
jgi:hypothetical protein